MHFGLVLQLMLAAVMPDEEVLCVPVREAYAPLLLFKYNSDSGIYTPEERATSQAVPFADMCLCLHSNADGTSAGTRVWQFLSGGSSATAFGVRLVVRSDQIPSGLMESVASLGLVGLYVSVVWQISRGLKASKHRLLTDMLYEDRDAANFIHQLCQDLYTARKFAKLDPRYFYLEERMWVQLQFLIRDTTQLLAVVHLEKKSRERAELEAAALEDQEDGAASSTSESDSDSSDDTSADGGDNDGDGGATPAASRGGTS